MTPKHQNYSVIELLKEFSKEYEDFIKFLAIQNLNLLTDHARGYCRGQTTLATDVVEDIAVIIDHAETEVKPLENL